MASAGSLIFELAADVSRLRTDMGKAQAEIKSSLDSIAKSSAVTALATGAEFAINFARGFADKIKAAIDQADALGKLAQRIGTTTEAMSGLQYAGSFAGVSLDDLTAGMKGLNKAVLDARDPLSDTAAAFKSFGLDAVQLRSMDPGAAFDSIATAVSKYADSAQKAAAVQQIFGKQSQVLIPLLNEGAEGIAAARKEAEDLGLIVSTATSKAMGDLNDDLERLENVGKGAAAQIAGELTPDLQELVSILQQAQKEGTTWNTVLHGIEIAAKGVVTTLIGLAGTVVSLGQFVMTVARTLDAPIGQIAETWKTGMAGAQKTMADTMSTMERTMHIRSEAEKQQNAAGAAAAAEIAAAQNAGKAQNSYTDSLDRNAKAHQRAKKEVNEYAQMLAQLSEALRTAQANGDQMQMLATDPKYLKFNEQQQATLRDKLQLTLDQTKANETLKKSQDDLAKVADDADKSLVAARESSRSFAESELDAIDPTREYTRTLAALDEAQKLIPISAEQMAAMQERAAKKMKDAQDNLDGTKDQLKDLQQAIEGFGKQSTDALVDFAFSTKDASVSFSEMVTSMLKDLAKLLIYKNVMEPLVKGISGGGATGWLSVFSSMAGNVPGRMAGGPVSPGQVYEINELPGRREYFIPNTPGKVVTDAGMSGSNGPNVAVTVHVHKNDEATEDTTADSRKAAELGKRVSAVVRQVIATEKRSGGLLAS
ncbi:phage tail tape measure protein [Paraburkholderia dipogonis]|uniref:hypothetical protein n=1 Tax=Paraburkholderia dipogonis TaxID=1211383 RepID=UPI0038B71AB3